MTDKEMLELAAKAYGFKIIRYESYDGMDIRHGFDEAISTEDGYWNPLVDDGDALRLAIRLEINLGFITDAVKAEAQMYLPDFTVPFAFENLGLPNQTPEQMTRRAIVLCAAQIGKEL